MDTFKGQDNEEVAKLCRENNCVLTIVPHDLTNRFQPLNVTFNNPAKRFIVSSKKSITYGILNRLLDNLTKANKVLKFRKICLRSNQYILSGFLGCTIICKDAIIINGFKTAEFTEAVEKR